MDDTPEDRVILANFELVEDIEQQDPSRSSRLNGTESESVPTRVRTIAFLDGLRGLAALLVYIFHHVSWFYGAEDPINHGFGYHGERYFATLPFVRSFFTGGSAAVSIFFILSGYVLSRSPLRLLRDGALDKCYRNLLTATIRRPFRLFIPPMGVTLTLAFIMQLPFGLAPRFSWPVAKESIFAELANWFSEICWAFNPLEAHGSFTRWFSYDPPIWTIAHEFQGSILVYALIGISTYGTPQYRPLFFGFIGLFLLFIYQWSMASFMFGVVLSITDLEELDQKLLLRQLSTSTKAIMYHIVFISGWYLLGQTAGTREPEFSFNVPGWYWLSMLIPSNYYENEYWRFWNTIGATMLVYAVLRIRWLQRILTTPTLRYLGRVSFSLYLVHIPLLWVVGDRIYRLFGMCRPGLETWFDNKLPVPDIGPKGLTTRFVFIQLLNLPLNLIVAEVGTVLLDEPSVKFGRWIISRLERSETDHGRASQPSSQRSGLERIVGKVREMAGKRSGATFD